MQEGEKREEEAPEVRLLRELAAGTFASNLTELDLANRNLTSLPPELCAGLPALTRLNMAGNALSTLPPELAQLTRLRIAFFLGNRFEEVPAVVGRLPALYMLSFKSCRLARVPEESLPPSLGWLILTDNQLEQLPASLGRLPQLRKLMLASNRLAALPDMSGCVALELVRLSDNRLTEVPPSLLALPRLAWLALGGNLLPPRYRDNNGSCCSAAELTWADLTVGLLLGEGASGRVHKAVLRVEPGSSSARRLPPEASTGSGLAVAVKLFRADRSSDGRCADEVAAAVWLAEQTQAGHPHLINLHGCVLRDPPVSSPSMLPAGGECDRPALVLELLDSSMQLLARTPSFDSVTRDVYASNERTFPLAFVMQVAAGVASAVAHLHTCGLIHGDVYAHNILVDSPSSVSQSAITEKRPLRVKLGDLGAAYFVPEDTHLARNLQQIESLALGHLFDELIQRCDDNCQHSPSLDLLRRLRDACLQSDIEQRPLASELALALQNDHHHGDQ